ncbi:helix-turn-helix domain-containing protein [Kitasatospora sp. NPDC056181]|uniref:helix-turn-helix domain-containing protein n=1 Tax=Kitasatospora sp. NPDC056181 TaxID=3345737 RepID=UPI0035D8EB26
MHRADPDFDADALTRRRQVAAISIEELASAVGVSRQSVSAYENGRSTPGPNILVRLATALSCAPRDLMRTQHTRPTFAGLRRSAGLTQRQMAVELAPFLGKDSSAEHARHRLHQLEAGITPREWRQDPSLGAQAVQALADLAPGWDRTEIARLLRCPAAGQRSDTSPGRSEPVPEPQQQRHTGAQSSEPPRGSAAARAWNDLNDRQRLYLVAVYREDQAAQAKAQAVRAAFGDPGPAQEWRKLPFTIKAAPALTGYTALQDRLREDNALDAGAGSTLAALHRRELIDMSEDQVEVFPLGGATRVLVSLTRAGRACARAGLDEQRPATTPKDMLSEWLWKNLVKVASAGPDGLAEDGLWGKSKFYLGTGFRPGRKAVSRGYIDSVPVRDGGGPQSYVVEYRWRLTDAGRAHIAQYVDGYRELYPDVELGYFAQDM